MKPSRWLEVKRVLGEALDLPREGRDEFLRTRCADEQLRAEVQRLLGFRERDAALLDAPTRLRHRPSERSASAGPDGLARTHTDAAAAASEDDAPAITTGTVLAGRYELLDRLGAGAFGTVYRATDRLTGGHVAVKVLTAAASEDPLGMRREIAVLRRARLPGLVDLLDDGVQGGRAFLVMRLVDGAPFPGELRSFPARWTDLAPRATALLEALGRLHWLGVLHRDLKPENVLVSADGVVTIVDLGVARQVDAFGDVRQGYLVGTPAYVAPERTVGAPATVASDLYAVGVMLYEALAGRPPRAMETIQDLVAARDSAATPLRSLVPDLPEHVARTIDAMVHGAPARRPRSARIAAALLRGQPDPDACVRLPFLGEGAAVDAVVLAVRERRAADLAGAPGAGRTRTLEEAERRLSAEGFRVLRALPATEPFGSLANAVGGLPPESQWTLADVRAWLRRCLRFWLGNGVAVFADDWERLDPQSRDVLESVRGEGPVVRALDGRTDGASEPPPLTEEALRALFRGPDRVFHLREDGAAELWRRTSGRPGDVVREIETWIDAGIARWEDDRIVIDRAGIERLETRLALTLRRADLAADAIPPAAADVAAVLEVAACPIPVESLCTVLHRAAWQVDADLERLVAAGVARRGTARTAEAVLSIDGAASWSLDRRRTAHAAIADALPPASERRLFHLLASDDVDHYLAEASDAAQKCLDEGNAERSVALLAEMISRMNRLDVFPDARVDATAWLLLDAALALGSPGALDRIAAEFERGRHETDAWRTCAAICEAAAVAIRGDPRRALDALRAIPAPASPRHRIRVLAVRAMAARLAGDHDAEREVAREGARIARSHHADDARAYFQDWLGWMHHRESRFSRAAVLHGRAARRRQTVRGRAIAMTNAASSHLQAGDVAAALEWARRAEGVAAHARIALAEARVAWILRRIAWRNGSADAVDVDLVDAVRDAVDPNLEAMICLQEATIALHAGRARTAEELAARARVVAERAGRRVVAAIADGLVAASAGEGAWRAAGRAFAAGAALLPSQTGIETAAICAPFVPTPDTEALRRALACARAESARGTGSQDICRGDEVVARLSAGEERP